MLKTSTTRGKGFAVVTDKKLTERDRIDSINKKKGMLDSADSSDKRTPELDVLPRNVDEADKPAPEDKEPEKIVKFTESELTRLVQAATDRVKREATPELERLKAEATATKEHADIEKARLQAELDEIRSDAAAKSKVLEGVFGTLGMPVPSERDGTGRVYIAAQETRGGISATDAAREINKIWESSSSKTSFDKNTARYSEQRDLYNFDRFIRQNAQAVREGFEEQMKKFGMFGGSSFTDAATVRTDIPPAFIDYLSSRVRMSHSQKFIFWQFCQVEIDAQKGIGDTIQIARILNQVAGVSESEWDITGLPALSTDNNPIQARSISVKIKEYGLGKGANKLPISFSEFLMARSLLDLEQALQMNLGRDYFEFEDVVIRNLYLTTTQVRYNQKNSLLTNPANFAAGDNGTLTYNYLNNLYADMSANQVPAFENGKYAMVCNPYALAQLKNSLGANNQYYTRDNLEDITNVFDALTAEEGMKISGYEFTIGNFMIFCSNNIGVGTVGVNTITVAGSPRTFRSSLAFGGGAVGRGIGQPLAIRRDNNDDFGRRNRFTWVSHEGFSGLDIDAAIVPLTDMQTRVFDIRTCDQPF